MPQGQLVTSRPIPILCYHKVGPARELGRRLNIEPDRLESHVRFFARRGYQSVLARDLGRPINAKSVCFTFDDGFAATLRWAPEILERHGLRGCFYVVTDRVGLTSQWEGGEDLPLAGWPELRRAAAKGHEIGNHTATHPRLADFPNAGAEIERAQKRLLSEGLPAGAFCYPYGSLPSQAPELLAVCGIQVGLSLNKGLAGSGSPLATLPRITVAYSHSLPALLYRLYLRFGLLKKA